MPAAWPPWEAPSLEEASEWGLEVHGLEPEAVDVSSTEPFLAMPSVSRVVLMRAVVGCRGGGEGSSSRSCTVPRAASSRRGCKSAAPVLAATGLLAVGALLVSSHTGVLRARAVSGSALVAEEQLSCERCPVGSCDRDQTTGACLWLPTFHCRVVNCSEVPLGANYSACWPWQGKDYYTFADREPPCRSRTVEEEQAAKAALIAEQAAKEKAAKAAMQAAELVRKREQAATAALKEEELRRKAEAEEAARKAEQLEEERRKGTLKSSGAVEVQRAREEAAKQALRAVVEREREKAMEDKLKLDFELEREREEAQHWHEAEGRWAEEAEAEAKATTTVPPPPGADGHGEAEAKATTSVPPPPGADGHGEAPRAPPVRNLADPRLAAYWDIDSCGPMGDDRHIEWCGGYLEQPTCQALVAVGPDLCPSGQAFLVTVASKDGSFRVETSRCQYMYFAQYACVDAPTSTARMTMPPAFATSPPPRAARSAPWSSSARNAASPAGPPGAAADSEGVVMLTDAARLERATAAAAAAIGCSATFAPPAAPARATELNGIRLPDVCITAAGPHYVQVIGDWGGIMGKEGPVPASERPADLFVHGVDDRAQLRVARQMAMRAATRAPDYVLNAGDSFYWGGLNVTCGSPANKVIPTGQFENLFEKVYVGKGLEGKPWLGVLGNHDYGGYEFDKGWDQLISYTWGPGGRWIMPAQFWRQTVRYPGFAVDYFFVDTNYFNAEAPAADPGHNICSSAHVKQNASCGATGPTSPAACPAWFAGLWQRQQGWLEQNLNRSTADWQIVVTHYPPIWGPDFWLPLTSKYGIDLFVTGHQHKQDLHYQEAANYLKPTAWLVSGGGGGITSEGLPDADGQDDQYGFFELTLTKEIIEIQGISHGGLQRSLAFLRPRPQSSSGRLGLLRQE